MIPWSEYRKRQRQEALVRGLFRNDRARMRVLAQEALARKEANVDRLRRAA